MARELVFKLEEKEFSFEPAKIERKKLYGWTETLALDDEGNECKLVSVDESGTVIIPKGSIGLGMVDQNFLWVERSQLQAVDEEGKAAQLLPSSFSKPILLDRTVTPEEFLDHQIVSVYQLEGAVYEDLIKAAKDRIYTFPFNYRDGYESSPAFLIEAEGKLFVLIGSLCEFSFIGLEEPGYLEEAFEEEESDELGIDFDMM